MGVGVSGTIRYDDMYEVPSSTEIEAKLTKREEDGRFKPSQKAPATRWDQQLGRDGASTSSLEFRGLMGSGAEATPRRRKMSEDENEGVLEKESRERWRGASFGGRVRIASRYDVDVKTERKKSTGTDSRKLKRRSAGGGRQTRGSWEPIEEATLPA